MQQSVHGPKLSSPRIMQRASTFLILSIMIVLAGSLLVGFVQRAWQEHMLNQAIKQQLAQNAEQRAQVLFLQGAADFAESDVAVEHAARERLGMAREGETVLLPTIVFSYDSTTASTPPDADTGKALPDTAVSERASEPNVVRWMRVLFPGADAVP